MPSATIRYSAPGHYLIQVDPTAADLAILCTLPSSTRTLGEALRIVEAAGLEAVVEIPNAA